MFRTLRWLMAGLVYAVASPALVAAPTFKDRAHVFSPEAVDEAKTLIAGIRNQFHKDVVVETFASVPFTKDPWGKVKKMSPAEQDQFVRKWAAGRLPGRNVIYVFILHAPGLKSVQVLAGKSLVARQEFTADDCVAVRDRLQGELTEQHADAGLLGALRLTQVLLHDRLGDGGSEPFDWELFLAIALFVGGVTLTFWLARGGRKAQPPAPVSEAVQRARAPARPKVVEEHMEETSDEPAEEWK